MKKYVFTCGDINGIGPEIVLRSFNKLYSSNIQFILPIPLNVFKYYSSRIKIEFPFTIVKKIDEIKRKNISVLILDLGNVKMDIGKPTSFSGKSSYKSVLEAHRLIKNGLASAMITAPLSKLAWQKANVGFPGHTEFLAYLDGSKNYSMMFLSKKFKCALSTIHEPIIKVPKLITKNKLVNLIKLINLTLSQDLNIPNPKIAVLGLNPHAGENGNIGHDEIQKIIPAIDEASKHKIDVDGPHVPDAFFANRLHLKYDVVIGMYHDQLLIPFKMTNFNKGVNYTAGLSFVRTSPDHGTAFDIAGSMNASIASITEAYKWARKIAKRRAIYAD